MLGTPWEFIILRSDQFRRSFGIFSSSNQLAVRMSIMNAKSILEPYGDLSDSRVSADCLEALVGAFEIVLKGLAKGLPCNKQYKSVVVTYVIVFSSWFVPFEAVMA